MGLLALGVLLLALGQTVTGLDAGLLHLAPALVLLLPLLAGRYVGEEQLERLVRSRSSRVSVPPRATAGPRPRAPRRAHVHGGALLAAGLGRRGPPVLARTAVTAA